jgi:hypothetical protein
MVGWQGERVQLSCGGPRGRPCLVDPEAGEDPLDPSLRLLLWSQLARPSGRDGRSDPVETGQPGDLFDEIYLPCEVPPERRHRHVEGPVALGYFEADRGEVTTLRLGADVEPHDRRGPLWAQRYGPRRDRVRIDVGHGRRDLRAGEPGHQLGGARRCVLHPIDVDAALEPSRGLRAQEVTLAGKGNGGGIEGRTLQGYGGGVLGDLRILTAHDAGEGDGSLRIADEQILW